MTKVHCCQPLCIFSPFHGKIALVQPYFNFKQIVFRHQSVSVSALHIFQKILHQSVIFLGHNFQLLGSHGIHISLGGLHNHLSLCNPDILLCNVCGRFSHFITGTYLAAHIERLFQHDSSLENPVELVIYSEPRKVGRGTGRHSCSVKDRKIPAGNGQRAVCRRVKPRP